MITEDFVSYKIAKLLNEKGFNEDCLYYYKKDNDCKFPYSHYHDFDIKDRIECPTHQMTKKWLSEKHSIIINIQYGWFNANGFKYQATIMKVLRTDYPADAFDIERKAFLCDKYEDAEAAAFEYILERMV
jgi:hypothetical protein